MPEDPSAEFNALRQEIESRRNIQNSLFVLQLTAVGVIFSFALSGKGRCGIFVDHSDLFLCAMR